MLCVLYLSATTGPEIWSLGSPGSGHAVGVVSVGGATAPVRYVHGEVTNDPGVPAQGERRRRAPAGRAGDGGAPTNSGAGGGPPRTAAPLPSFDRSRRSAAEVVNRRRRVGLLRVPSLDAEERRLVVRAEEVVRQTREPVEPVAGTDPEVAQANRDRQRARAGRRAREAGAARRRRRPRVGRMELERGDRQVGVVDSAGLDGRRAVRRVVAIGEG